MKKSIVFILTIIAIFIFAACNGGGSVEGENKKSLYKNDNPPPKGLNETPASEFQYN